MILILDDNIDSFLLCLCSKSRLKNYTCSSLCISSPVLLMRTCCFETLSSMSANWRIEPWLFLVMKVRWLNFPIRA